jgi:drug/metabolite transporter (DMT)-like permease
MYVNEKLGSPVACGTCVLRMQPTSTACLRCSTEQLLTTVGAVDRPPASNRRSTTIAISCLIATAICWGSAFRFTEIALVEIDPLHLTSLRCMIGAVVVCIAAALYRSSVPDVDRQDPVLRRRARLSLLSGGLCTGAAYTAIAVGQVGATSTTTGVILGTVPVWTAVIVWMASRRVPTQQTVTTRLVAALVLGTGAAAIPAIADPASAPAWAVATLIAAAIFHAGSMATIQPAVAYFGPLRSTAGVTLLALMLTLPAWLVGSVPSWPSTTVLVSVLLLGLFPTGIAYVTFFEAVRRLGARTAALAVYLIPAVALAVGWISDPRLVGGATLLGALCGVAAVALGVTSNRRTAAAAAAPPRRPVVADRPSARPSRSVQAVSARPGSVEPPRTPRRGAEH